MTNDEAIKAIDSMMIDHKFGASGAKLVLEELWTAKKHRF
jgi:phosphoribosylamine-glycine ligase